MKSTSKIWMRRLSCLAVVLVSLFIWGNSLAPATESSAQSGRIVALLPPVLEKLQVEPSLRQFVIRKGAHMTEFALLAVAWMSLLWHCRGAWYRKIFLAAVLCMTTAFLDETIQLFVPGRSGQISDVWVDLLGAAVGIALFSSWSVIWTLRQHRN